MRYIIKLINLLFIFSIPLTFIALSLALVINIPAIYEYEFNKYDVGHSTVGAFTNLDSLELKHIAQAMPDYFNSGGEEEPINLIVRSKELFNEKEKVHMVDIKKLVRLDYSLLLILSMFIAAYTLAKVIFRSKSGWRSYFIRLLVGAGITLGLIIALGLLLIFDFNGFFMAFHMVSFSNLFWILDYSTDNLINLFPTGFFFDASLYIALMISIEAVLLAVASIIFLLITRKTKTPTKI